MEKTTSQKFDPDAPIPKNTLPLKDNPMDKKMSISWAMIELTVKAKKTLEEIDK